MTGQGRRGWDLARRIRRKGGGGGEIWKEKGEKCKAEVLEKGGGQRGEEALRETGMGCYGRERFAG